MTRLRHQILTTSVGVFGSNVVGIVASIVIARWLGVQQFGVYGFALGYVTLWSVVMDGGCTMLATRLAARRADPKVIRAMLTLKPVLVGLTAVGLGLGVGLAGFDRVTHVPIAVIAVGMAVASYLGLGLAVFRGHQQFGVESGCLVTQRVLFALLAVVALAASTDVNGVSAAWTLSWVLVALPVLVLLRRRHGIRVGPDIGALRQHGQTLLRAAGPLFIADVLTQAHARNAPVLLQIVSGATEVGTYVAARRLVEGLHLLPVAVGIALFPRLATADQSASDDARVALRLMGVFSAAVCLGGWLWADEAITLLFGVGYARAVGPLQVMLGTLAIMTVNSVLSLMLVARGGARAYAVVLGIATVANLAFVLPLVREFGALAAAWASVVSEGALCVGCLWALGSSARTVLPLREWGQLWGATAAALAGLLFVKSLSPVVAVVLTGAAIVAGIALLSPVPLRDLFRRGLRQSGAARIEGL
ncbi:MAG: oligosaccharide flippase family protein [Candidatus Rokuibacteriota bacterium]